MKSLGKIYQPQKEEKKIYRLWEKSGYFNPDNLPKTKKGYFSIIMPPPNANDPLHIGHAVFVSLAKLKLQPKNSHSENLMSVRSAFEKSQVIKVQFSYFS